MKRSYSETVASNLLSYGLLLWSPAIGLLLADLPDLKLYKVLNLVGVTWSVFGVLTFSYLVTASEAFQLVVLRLSSFLFTFFLFHVPLGLAIGGIFGSIFHYPSGRTVATAGLYLMVPGGLSAVFFMAVIRHPTFKFADTPRQRIAAMGGYFVLVGLISQWLGSLFDLIEFSR